MAEILKLKNFHDSRGSLCVLDEELPFSVKRAFFLYDVLKQRGGHMHKKSRQALICLSGSCRINVQTPEKDLTYTLSDKNSCLLLEPHDWHTMDNFTQHSILLVLASESYTPDDYIYEPYR
jgi:dTDP-4-dehydrorhamnose 3,5-epimerase-like enzyme